MFDRWEALIGKGALDRISKTNVLVLGCGGVGGHAIEALVRSNISNITIVDGDVVDETNLNRQLIALHSTLGRKKVDVMKERLLDISPALHITTIDKFLTASDIESLNLDDYDYVIDAIDDTKVKVELIKKALISDTKLIVSTGTARKLDPSKLKISTLDKTSYDPLARSLRQNLKGFDLKKVVCLYSDEETIILDNGILGSSAFVPSTAGLLIASYVINDIIKN